MANIDEDPAEGEPGDGGPDDRGRRSPGLAAWLAEVVADDAAAQRSRLRWLEQQAAEEGTFIGVLTDLAERDRPVVLQLANGRTHRGTLTMIGADVVGLSTAGGRDVLLRQSAIASVRTLPGEPVTVGDRHIVSDVSLSEAMSALAEHRARVHLIGSDPTQAVTGELRAVGRDVVTVRLDGAGGTAYVAVAALVELSLFESG